MFSKINIYIFKNFLYWFLVTLAVFAVLVFIGDFVEQFRKSATKDVPITIILQLSAYNFLNLTTYTLPVTVFFASLFTFLHLIRTSEFTIVGSSGISLKSILIPPIFLYLLVGIFFITSVNPLMALFEDQYSELEYEYINRVDKFASITKNGMWLKQDNLEKNISSILFANNIKDEGKTLSDFMILEYDSNGVFQGRIDGKIAELKEGYWEMEETQVSPKYDDPIFYTKLIYSTNIKIEDISDSLSSPQSISFWRLGGFVRFLEELGYSAIEFKLHYYNLIFLPFLLVSLVILSASISNGLKSNDKFFMIIIYSFILIFMIYFLSNLFDALGASSQIHPLIAKGSMPIITLILSFIVFRLPKSNN